MDPVVLTTRQSLLLGFMESPMTLSQMQAYFEDCRKFDVIEQTIAYARHIGGSHVSAGLIETGKLGRKALDELLEPNALLRELIALEELEMVQRIDRDDQIVWQRSPHVPSWIAR